ncbi:MAG TPA: DUF3887 domain-containing protein [Gammaproteobacteria bacterium]|nr:DUF3887 domain-containing protein [Gammaproteobacteria bacterium]
MMKATTICAVSALLFLAAGTTCAAAAAAAASESRVQQAETLVHEFANGQFAAAEADFTTTMKQKLPPSRLKQVWHQLTTQFGPYQGTGKTEKRSRDGYTVVLVTTHFKQRDLRAKVVTNDAGQVAGLFFRP